MSCFKTIDNKKTNDNLYMCLVKKKIFCELFLNYAHVHLIKYAEKEIWLDQYLFDIFPFPRVAHQQQKSPSYRL